MNREEAIQMFREELEKSKENRAEEGVGTDSAPTTQRGGSRDVQTKEEYN